MLYVTLEDTLAALASGTFTSETLTAAYVAQIVKYEETLNAFTFLNRFALSQANTSDRRRAAGAPIGPWKGCDPVLP